MTDERDPLALPKIVKKSATDVRRSWSENVNEAASGEEQIVIEKNGTPIAALISASDLKLYRRLVAQRRERFKAIEEVSRRFSDVPEDELEQEIGRIASEVRQERFKALYTSWEATREIPEDEIESEIAAAVAAIRSEKGQTTRG